MKRLILLTAAVICMCVVLSNGAFVSGETPSVSNLLSDRNALFSPTPTPPADINERSWERWWYGNRGPLLVDLTPAFKKPPQDVNDPAPTRSSYEVFPSNKPKSLVSEEKVNLLQLLVLIGYGGPFKEITREMALTELEARGDKALDDLIEIATGRVTLSPVAGMSSRQLRNYAILALGEIHSPKSFDPVVEQLRNGEQETQFFAAMALGRLGDRRAIPVLLDVAADGRNQYIRPAICLALGMMGANEGLSFMQDTYKTGAANEEKLFAALSIGMLGAKDPKEELMKVIRDSNDPLEKALAAFAFLSLCEEKSDEPDAVISLLDESDDFTRITVLMGCGLLLYRSNLTVIFKVANESSNPSAVRKAAMLALSMSNSKDGNALLTKLMDSMNGEMADAAQICLDLMVMKTRDSLLDNWALVKDKEIRAFMPFVAVRHLGEPAVAKFDRLQKLVADYDPVYMAMAYGWAFEVGKPLPVLKLMNASEIEDRAKAIVALAVSGTDYAVENLIKASYMEGPEKMAHTIALKCIGPKAVLKFLRDNPQHGNPRVSIGVASALGGIKCEGVEDALDMYTSFYNPDVRCYAYLAMGRLGTREACERLALRYPVEKHPFALGNLVLAAGFALRVNPRNEELINILRSAMVNTAHGEVRAYAALAWGVSNDINRYDMIGSIFGSDRDPRVLSASALALGLSSHESAVYSLRRALEEKSYKQVREFGCYALGVMKNRDGLPGLLGLVKDKDNDVRMAATVSAGAFRDNSCKGVLKPVAEDDGYLPARRIASVGLILLGDGLGFETFLASFKGRGDDPVREMGWVELTEVSNLYVPVGFRIDDYMQDSPIPEAEQPTKN